MVPDDGIGHTFDLKFCVTPTYERIDALVVVPEYITHQAGQEASGKLGGALQLVHEFTEIVVEGDHHW